MLETGTITGALQVALLRLDTLIRAAVERAQLVYSPSAAQDSYRGLYVNAQEAELLLARVPGEPLLWRELEAGGDLGLADEFGLSEFDLDVLLLALAPEFDLKYERLFGFLQDDVTRKRPTVNLALDLLCPSAESRLARRRHFNPDAPLIAQGLVRLIADPAQSEPSLLAHYLKADEQVLAYLMGEPGLDRRLEGFCRLILPETVQTSTLDSEMLEMLVRLSSVASTQSSPCRVFLEGPRDFGQHEAAEVLARGGGAPLLAANLDRAAERQADWETLVPILFREARFRRTVLFLEGAELLPPRLLETHVNTRSGLTVASGPRALPNWFSISIHAPGGEASCRAWESFAAQEGLELSRETAKTLSGRLKLTLSQIHYAVGASRCHAAARGASEPGLSDFMAAARAHSGQNLSTLARKVSARHRWEDIVLPDDTFAQLHEMCQRVERRRQVLEGWGFERKLSSGKGVNALFAGPSGSGKTMAAEVIANELDLDLYKIDLSGVVSKYIGETEKNLDRIFNAAENSNAILFFDEADALFGKRSEVRDSHDRYANLEISYLLQKMEEYSGVAILATNLRQNLDDAFFRRLTFSVHFPFPDEAARTRIWEGIWPAGIPLAADVDAGLLARRVKLSGGSIRNIALAAAFLAAAQGTAVSTEHVLQAVRREYQKFGKQLELADLPIESLQRAAS
jgi:hypothetical protein